MRVRTGLMALSAVIGLPTPALAHGHQGGMIMPPPPMVGPMGWGGNYGSWQGGWQPSYEGQASYEGQPYEGQPQTDRPDGPPSPYDRDSWLRECRRRLGDNGVGGAVIGGVVGGVAGNVIAGHGNKLVGTVAGAAVGALAGHAIDKAEDAPRVRDRCEAMLEARQGYSAPYGGAQYGSAPYRYAGYGYAMPVMMVPVMMVPAPQGMGQRHCKETVTTTTEYIDLPRRSRDIPRRAMPDKRVRIVPDKRVPIK